MLFEIEDGSAERVIAAFGSVAAATEWVGAQLAAYTVERERATAQAAAVAEAMARVGEPAPLVVAVSVVS